MPARVSWNRIGTCLCGAALALGLLVSAGCGAGSTGPEEKAPEATLVVGLAAEPDSFNIYLAGTSASLIVADLILPRLAREVMPDETHEGGLEPSLATSWQLEQEGRRLVFHLKPGPTWDDGAPIVCADLQYTLSAQTSPEVAWRGASIKRHIQRIECEDEHTAVFLFDRGYPGQVMDANDLHILPRALEAIPFSQWRQTNWAEKMISGGLFRVASVTPGQQIILERRPEAGAIPEGGIRRLVLRIVADSSSRLTQLLSGDLDLLDDLNPDQLPRLAREKAVVVVRRPGHRYTYIGWNTLDPAAYGAYRRRKQAACDARGDEACLDEGPEIARLAREHPHPFFGDSRVRRAMTLAIDRQTLVDTLLLGEGQIPASPLLAPLPEHDPEIEPRPYDPEQARRLLAEAGFSDSDGDGVLERRGKPFRFRLAVQAGRAERRRAAELIAGQLAAVGVVAEIDPVQNAVFYPALGAHEVDAWVGGWRTSLRVDMSEMLHAGACASGGANFGCWSDEQADALADRAKEERDTKRRVAAWREWERIFERQQPYTMLYSPRQLTAVRSRVHGPRETILPGDPLAGIETWRIGKE